MIIQAFSEPKTKKASRVRTNANRRNILRPKIDRLTQEIFASDNPQSFLPQVIELIRLSCDISCPSKPSFTFEEAAIASIDRQDGINPYLCMTCGYIHFGHESTKLLKLLTITSQNSSK